MDGNGHKGSSVEVKFGYITCLRCGNAVGIFYVAEDETVAGVCAACQYCTEVDRSAVRETREESK